MNEQNGTAEALEATRLLILATRIITWSISILVVVSAVVIGVTAIFASEEVVEVSRMVFTATVPLAGTWVGTVLAYYFSKDNFNAARRSLENMVDKVTARLQGISVQEKMLAFDKNEVEFCQLPDGANPETNVNFKTERGKGTELFSRFGN